METLKRDDLLQILGRELERAPVWITSLLSAETKLFLLVSESDIQPEYQHLLDGILKATGLAPKDIHRETRSSSRLKKLDLEMYWKARPFRYGILFGFEIIDFDPLPESFIRADSLEAMSKDASKKREFWSKLKGILQTLNEG